MASPYGSARTGYLYLRITDYRVFLLKMKNKTLKGIEPILKEIKHGLRKFYGSKLKEIILYGSYARGDADDGSDIDILVLLDNVKNPLAEGDKISDFIWDLDLKNDTVIFTLPIDVHKYRTEKSPLILNVKKEGIKL